MTVDTNINTQSLEIPSMLIQPFIENAIWHGILPSKKEGLIKIHFSQKTNNLLTISIEDNGIGFEESQKLKKSEHIGRSLQIVNERMAVLNKKNNTTQNAVVYETLKQDGEVLGALVVVHVFIRVPNQ